MGAPPSDIPVTGTRSNEEGTWPEGYAQLADESLIIQEIWVWHRGDTNMNTCSVEKTQNKAGGYEQ